jgi:hypothetical protein
LLFVQICSRKFPSTLRFIFPVFSRQARRAARQGQ